MPRVLLLALLLLTRPAAGIEGTTEKTRGEPAILVELFTSQGCSSCPPADRLLSKLVAEDRVIALAFHVDYWNYIGWTDPFSAAAWSDRQRAYAAAFGSNRIYTPQLVVNGRWEGVGADPDEVERLLERAAGSARDEIALDVSRRGRLVRLRLSASTEGRARRAWVAVAESGFETPVGSGENAHRKLRNDNVVRRLEAVELAPAGTVLSGECELEMDPEWRSDRVRLVAFLEDPATLHVTGAAQAALP